MPSFVVDTTPLRVSPAFRRLWWGLAISNLGAQLTVVAVGLQVYAITGSTASVGLLGLCALVPLVIFGLYGGAIVDHYDRRRVALVASLVTVGRRPSGSPCRRGWATRRSGCCSRWSRCSRGRSRSARRRGRRSSRGCSTRGSCPPRTPCRRSGSASRSPSARCSAPRWSRRSTTASRTRSTPSCSPPRSSRSSGCPRSRRCRRRRDASAWAWAPWSTGSATWARSATCG